MLKDDDRQRTWPIPGAFGSGGTRKDENFFPNTCIVIFYAIHMDPAFTIVSKIYTNELVICRFWQVDDVQYCS